MATANEENNAMFNEDLPFIIIGVVLGGLVLIIGIILLYNWIKERKNQHLNRRYKVEANVYSTHQQTPDALDLEHPGDFNTRGNIPAEPIYIAVDSFRRGQTSNREQAETSSSPDTVSPSSDTNDHLFLNRQRSKSENLLHSTQQSTSRSETPPPVPVRTRSSFEVSGGHCYVIRYSFFL